MSEASRANHQTQRPCEGRLLAERAEPTLGGEYRVQGIPVSALAETYGTPLYVYDGDALREQYQRLRDCLPERMEIFYSLKANPNVSVCALLRGLGARAEVSSLVELLTARRAGVDSRDIVFLGPGKSEAELTACLDHDIGALVCESFGELAAIDELARVRGKRPAVALRVNPDVAVTRAGLAMAGKPRQFGIDEQQLFEAPGLAGRFPHIRLIGVHAYLGTRILDAKTIVDNTAHLLDLAPRLADRLGFPLELVDVGGGLGVAYFDTEPDLDDRLLADLLAPVVDRFTERYPATRLALEAGRYLAAGCGIYVARVRYVKTSRGERFAVTDGGTNHHMAAVGIGSFAHRNFPIRLLNRAGEEPAQTWQVCGPLCTPGDTVGKNVLLPPVQRGDLIGVLRSGAYGPTASPGLFLSHGYPAEVLVDRGAHHLVRERDRPADLLRPQRRYDHTAEA